MAETVTASSDWAVAAPAPVDRRGLNAVLLAVAADGSTVFSRLPERFIITLLELAALEVRLAVRRGQPATFPLNGVIKGWTEGVQLMPTGSKWRFYIPPHLAYGDRQAGAQIGPNSTLIFDVELISFS